MPLSYEKKVMSRQDGLRFLQRSTYRYVGDILLRPPYSMFYTAKFNAADPYYNVGHNPKNLSYHEGNILECCLISLETRIKEFIDQMKELIGRGLASLDDTSVKRIF